MKSGYKFILTALAILILLSLAGCSEASREEAAHRRWDRTLEQARIEAAQLSIEQGRLAYARALLEELVDSNSAFSDEAAEALVQIRLVTEQFAQARLGESDKDESLMN